MRTWCGACKTVVKTCRKNGKELSQCEHIDKLQYRAVVFIPGTKQRIVRSLGKNFNEAIKQLAIIRQQVENGEIQESEPNQPKSVSTHAPVAQLTPVQANWQTKPVLATHFFGKYLATLKGEGVPAHLKLVRSKVHISDVKNTFKQFCLALNNSGYNLETFQLADISDEVIGKFHDHILAKGYSNNSYNRFFSHFMTFASWAEGQEYGSVKRFFERVPRKTVTPRPEIISADEFKKLLSVINYENGFQYGIGRRKEKRNHYRDYLIAAIRFALYTGRRREEIVTVRFCDVHADEKGNPLYITFLDHKVSRILHLAPGEERENYTPITKELMAFLNEQGYQEKKGTGEFILAPMILHNRAALMKHAITRGFSHFWSKAHPEVTRQISFKTLRKTYLTNLSIRTNGNVRPVSGHTSEQVLKHYIDEKQVAIAASLENFSVLGNEEELKEQRKKSRGNQKTIER